MDRRLINLIGLLFLLSQLIACGAYNEGKDCSGNFKELCHNLFGGRESLKNDQLVKEENEKHTSEVDQVSKKDKEQDDRLNGHDEELVQIKSRIDSLKEMIDNGIGDILFLDGKLFEMETTLNEYKELNTSNSVSINVRIAGLETTIQNANNQIDLIQDSIVGMVSNLAILNGYELTTGYYDPCGNDAGYDEVFHVTTEGRLLAYVEIGTNRRLSFIEEGNWKTSDGTSCYFTAAKCPTTKYPNKMCISNEHH